LENDKKNSLDLARSSFATMKKKPVGISKNTVFEGLNSNSGGADFGSIVRNPDKTATTAKLTVADDKPTNGVAATPDISVTTPLGLVLKSKALVSISPFNKPQTSAKNQSRKHRPARPTTKILKLANASTRHLHATAPSAKAKDKVQIKAEDIERGPKHRISSITLNGKCCPDTAGCTHIGSSSNSKFGHQGEIASNNPSTMPSIGNDHQTTDALLSIGAYDSSSS
ncbi:hypothetical protein AYI70_g3933, partial [Smittium culicis]